jgi:hypothetical protein
MRKLSQPPSPNNIPTDVSINNECANRPEFCKFVIRNAYRMLAMQTLRRPANWQDFEQLSFRLWRADWKCPELQMNGRLGQDQNGVDIFGIPKGEDEYLGIQCKGKSEYNDEQYDHPQFTTSEIDQEIEKAKTFEPKLKKLYFATTALNDAKIQTFIRKKNLEHIAAALFEVHLFCWEAIANLIDEHKEVHDWYVNNQKYRVSHSAEITFADGTTEIKIAPKFRQINTLYYPAVELEKLYPPGSPLANIRSMQQQFQVINQPDWGLFRQSINHSLVPIRVRVTNTGHASIEDFKLTFRMEGDIERIEEDNISGGMGTLVSLQKAFNSLQLSKDEIAGKIVTQEKALVGKDNFLSPEIYLRPTITGKSIVIKVQLMAKEFNMERELLVNVKPEIVIETKEIAEHDIIKKRRVERGAIEEFIEPIK